MKCRKCHKTKPLKEFYFNKTKGDYERMCAPCHRLYRKEHYKKNKPAYLAKAKKRNAEIKKEVDEFLKRAKDKPCIDCGRSFPQICMDFDHRDAKQKFKGVAQMRAGWWSKEKIEQEVAKCDLVCSNCHRLRTQHRIKNFRM